MVRRKKTMLSSFNSIVKLGGAPAAPAKPVPATRIPSLDARSVGLELAAVHRAAIIVQTASRRRSIATRAVLRRWTHAANCVQRHARRWASRSATDRPFVLRLRRQLMLFMISPCGWIAWLLAFSSVTGVPLFWATAMLGLPGQMAAALSVVAHLKLGPAWCSGLFLETLGLRMFGVLHPLLLMVDVVLQATSAPEDAAANAAFFLQVGVVLCICLGTLSGVLPAPRGTRYYYIGVNAACMAVKHLSTWQHVEGNAVALLAPPLLCALCGHLSHISVSAALHHTSKREEAMGDLRRLLDADGAVEELVDSTAINTEWSRGPLTQIYKWGVLLGLGCHACDVFTLCLGHGCYTMADPSVLCVRYATHSAPPRLAPSHKPNLFLVPTPDSRPTHPTTNPNPLSCPGT